MSVFAGRPGYRVGERGLDRRRFLLATASGVVVAGIQVRDAKAATENDLAYANFGLATSYLVADFYTRSLEAGKLETSTRPALRRGRAAATLHAREFMALLTGAGDTPATAEDFTFEWPGPDVRDSREHQTDRHRRPAGEPRGLPTGGSDAHGAHVSHPLRKSRGERRAASRDVDG